MALKKTFRLAITLEAGTGKFFTDMKAAGVEVREFEKKVNQVGPSTRSSMAASSAALKELEGNFGNNNRAIARFLANTVGLGPALQAAFPLIGGLAFGTMVVELGGKVKQFFQEMRDGPAKTANAFRELNQPMRLTSDEMQVANDRLENEIAKLEGHHENTLKLALDEARVAADRLADSLSKDLSNLNKLLKEEEIGGLKRAFGSASTDDLRKELGGETGAGGFTGAIAKITDEGNEAIRRSTDLKTKDAAATALNTRLAKAYGDEVVKLSGWLANAQNNQNVRNDEIRRGMPVFLGVDQTGRIEELTKTISTLRAQASFIPQQATNTALTARKESLEASRANAQQDKPFEDRMKLLGAQIDAIKAKLEAIGQPEAARLMALAFGDAQKAIVETNKALERNNTQLTQGQRAQILTAEQTIVTTEAEAAWRTKLAATTTSIQDRIRSQELLTAAIGKGYEATRAANIETRLMSELGEHYNDSAWMQSHHADVSGLRTGYTREFDAQHGEQSGQAVQGLSQRIELERDLSAVQAQGAEAVRQVTLALKLRQMAIDGATKEQLHAEMELYNAERGNAAAGDVAKIDERIAATQRLTAAILGGAEAVRRAGLENKLAEIRREGDTPIPGTIGIGQRGIAAVNEDSADHTRQVTEAAAQSDRVGRIGDQIQKLTEAKDTLGATLAIEISLRDLENQRLRVLAEQSLQLRGARDGVRAFFLEMQQDAKGAASVVYEAMHSALDQSSANLAKLMTGQKTAFGKEFQGVGEKMLDSSIKSAAQKGLGELGKHFAPAEKFAESLGMGKPDGSSAMRALWVRFAGAAIPGVGGAGVAGSVPSAAAGGVGGALNLGSKAAGGVLGFFKSLMGLGGAGSAGSVPSVSSSISFGGAMADGGPVDPGVAYRVNENEQEYFIPSSRGSIVPHPGAMSGVTIHNHNAIDARGADLGAANRIQRGIEASHRQAVSTAIQGMHERQRRVPAK
jgi:hypothetical protein